MLPRLSRDGRPGDVGEQSAVPVSKIFRSLQAFRLPVHEQSRDTITVRCGQHPDV